MIDQARYRHQKQQNLHRLDGGGKFKDAIDYLDQIFEDLRKECDGPLPVCYFFYVFLSIYLICFELNILI